MALIYKRPVTSVVLLGAGASIEAGVPGTKELARRMYEATKPYPELVAAMEVAIGGLKYHQSVAHDPFGDIDIESLYQILRLLGERSSNVLSPFIGAWSHATIGADRRDRRYLASMIVRSLADGIRSIDAGNDRTHPLSSASESDFHRLSDELESALRTDKRSEANAFSACADFVLKEMVRACWIGDGTRVEYIRPLISTRKSRVWIASLNYDNAIELAAEQIGIPIDLGVRNGDDSVNFSSESRVSLAKLHGSVSWSYQPDGRFFSVGGPMDERTAIIFGSGNKLQINGPYIDLLFAFRSRLESVDTLKVCGYSFRDQHVNHLLLTWLRGKNQRIVEVCDPLLSADDVEENIRIAMPTGWRNTRGAIASRLQMHKSTASEYFAAIHRR